jgi:signal transduction histidine kinase
MAGISQARRRLTVDAIIAIAVTALGLLIVSRAGSWHHAQEVRPEWLAYLLVAVGGLSLAVRRRFPVAVLAITLAAALWAARLNTWGAWFALLVAFFTASVAGKRVAAIVSLVVGYLVTVLPPGHTTGTAALALLAFLIALLAAAELLRASRARAAEVASRRSAEALRRSSEERMAMARDLHDVLAHNISVINVQANTALHLMDRQPERAREALTAIHQVSKQALAELRSVLGVLRDPSGDPLTPGPGLDRLGDLASGTAGIEVRLVTEGAVRPVPAGVDVAAYRIVQEALTNAVRHSGGSTATVSLRYHDDALVILVEDDGAGASGGSAGNGLAGMAERARALGGTLDTGQSSSGGFRVLAWFPA